MAEVDGAHSRAASRPVRPDYVPNDFGGCQRFVVVAGFIALLLGLVCCGLAGWVFQKYTHGDFGGDKKDKKQERVVGGYRDGQFTFFVREVRCGVPQVGQGDDSTEARGQYCLVTIKVHNVGSQPRVLLLGSQSAYASNGQEYLPDSAATEFANGGQSRFPDVMSAGDELTATMVFDIPREASLTKLELHDFTFSKGVTVPL